MNDKSTGEGDFWMAPCPFCDERDGLDAAEAMGDNTICAGCCCCGGLGPSVKLDKPGEVTDADRLRAIARWNQRHAGNQ